MKWVLVVFLLFPIIGYSTEDIDVEFQETYTYHSPGVISVVPFDEKRAIEFKIEKDKVIFYGNREGYTSYLVVGEQGSETVIVRVNPRATLLRRGNQRDKVYHGSLRFSGINQSSNNSSNQFYSLMGNLHYKLGDNSYFEGFFNGNSKDVRTYYGKYSWNNFFIGSGYKTLEPRAFPSFFWREGVKLTEIGYEGSKINFSAFTGTKSEYFYGLRENRAYGIHSHYIFGKRNHRLDFDFFSNPKYGLQAPYFNLYYNYSDEINLNIAGGNPDKPLFRMYGDYSRMNRKKWGLSSLNFDYSYQPKGQEQLFYETDEVKEQVSIYSDFSSESKGNSGGFYLGPNYERVLSGNYLKDKFGLNIGWQSRQVHVGSRNFYLDTDLDTAPSKTLFFNPTVSVLVDEYFKRRTWVTLYQRHLDVSSPFGVNYENDISFSGLKVSRSNYFYSLYGEFGRSNQKFRTTNKETALFGFGGLYRFGNGLTFNTKNRFVFTRGNDSGLSNVLSSVSLGWKPNVNHFFQLRGDYRLFKNGTKKTSTSLRLDYTYRFGGRDNPIKKLFASKSVSGFVFEDINNNGIFDNGEKPIEGVEINFYGGKFEEKDTSSSSGWYRVRGLDKGVYTISMRLPEKYKKYISQTKSIDITKSLDYNIPIIKTREVFVRVKDDKSGEFVNQEIDVKCDDFNYSYPVFSRKSLSTKVYLPVGQVCEVFPVLSEGSSGIQVVNSLKEKSEDFDENLTIRVKRENSIVVQAVLDENQDSTYDFGEELEGLKVKIGNKVYTSDISGEIFTTLNPGKNKIKILNRKGCFLETKEIMVYPDVFQNFSIQIFCKP